MVAAPETKTASTEVVATKETEKSIPTAEDIKKTNASDKEAKDAKTDTVDEAKPEGSKDAEADNSELLKKAEECLSSGKKCLLQGKSQEAVDALADACANMSKVHGDMHYKMCEYYFYYGRALLDVARIEGDVLGNALAGVPEGDDVDNSQVEDPDKLTEEEREDVAQKVDEALEENYSKSEVKETKSTDGNKKKEVKDAKEEDKEEEETEDMEEGDEQIEEDTTQEDSQDEEDVSSLQLAYEVLELAKTIYEKSDDKSEDAILKLSQVYLKLGEVGLENENYPESIAMYTECLKQQESILSADDRWLAETHYQLGLAHSLADNFDEAVKHLQRAIDVIEARIKSRTEKLTKEDVKMATDMDMSKLSEEQKSSVSDVRELEKLLPELQEKMTDIKDTKASYTEKLKAMKAHFSGQLSGGSSGKSAFEVGASTSGFGSSDDKGAKPINTMLIRKKRKPEDQVAPAEANKKPRTEEANGSTEEETKKDDKKTTASKEESKSEKKTESKKDTEEKMDVEEDSKAKTTES